MQHPNAPEMREAALASRRRDGGGPLSRLKTFAAQEDGTFLVFGLFVFMVMFLIGGIAVDVMRAEHRRVQLQNTLDNAVLASANLQQQREPKLVLEDYFMTAGLDHTLAPVDASGYTVKTDERHVNGSAGTDVPTIFMRLMGYDSLPAGAGAAAEEAMGDAAPENREVSIVIDISGSMRNNGRIDELREATKELVTILLTGDVSTTTSINVIPYAGHVNPGPEMFEILGGIEYGTTGGHMYPELDTFPEITKDISNVVFYYDEGTAGAAGYDYTARMEGYPGGDVALFNKDDLDEYVWFADAYIKRQASSLDKDARLVGVSAKAGNEIHVTHLTATQFDPIDTKKDKGTVDHTVHFNSFYAEIIGQFSSCLDYGPSDFQHTGLPSETWYAQVPHFMYWPIDANSMDWGWCPEDDTAIRYASNDEAALHAFIDSLRLHDGSGAHHGLKWGLALLDPTSSDEFQKLAWHGIVPTQFADRPAAWSDTTTQKYIVLMSEGVVATEWRPENPLDPANATLALREQADTPWVTHTSAATNVESFLALCDAAKAQEVEIFAIAFEAGPTGKQQLAECASSPAHYFDVDGVDLSSTFSNVGGQLTQLRLTE